MIKKIRKKFKPIKISDRWVLKLFSLIFSICLWLFVSYVVNPDFTKIITQVPIEVNLEQKDNFLIMNNYKKTTNIKITGKRNDLISLDKSNLVARVNLDNISLGEKTYDIQISSKNPNIKIIPEKDNKVKLDIDKKSKIKKKISVEYIGVLEDNMIPKYELEKDYVEVEGAKRDLERLKGISLIVNLQGKKEDFEANLKLEPVFDNSISERPKIKLSDESLNIKIKTLIRKKIPVRKSFQGKLENDLYIDSINLSTNKISLLLNKKNFDKVNFLFTEKIDLSKFKKTGNYKLDLKIEKSDKYDRDTIESIKTEIIIKKLSRKKLTLNTDKIDIISDITDIFFRLADNQKIELELVGKSEDLKENLLDKIIASVVVREKFTGLKEFEFKIENYDKDKIKIEKLNETVNLIMEAE